MRNKKLAATFLALTLVSAATPASAEGMEVDWDILLHFGNEHRQSGPPRHEPPPPPPRHPGPPHRPHGMRPAPPPPRHGHGGYEPRRQQTERRERSRERGSERQQQRR